MRWNGMRSAAASFGITGSVIVFTFGVILVFFRQDILPASGKATGFDPDLFVLLLSGILGLFGGLTGAAGSALAYYSNSPEIRGAILNKDPQLPGIMLLGAAVSGAVMFSGLLAVYSLTYINFFREYAVIAAGITAFLLLAVSGVMSFSPRKTEEEPEP